MKYIIKGADRQTGQDMEISLEATNAQAAEGTAWRMGLLVSSIIPQQDNRGIVDPVHHNLQPQGQLEQGHVAGVPIINVSPPRRGSSLGIASIILGALAFLICWIPLLGAIGAPLSALGLLLALIGIVVALTRKGSGVGYPIAGALICAVSLFVTIGLTAAIIQAFNGTGKNPAPQSNGAGAQSTPRTPAAPSAPSQPDLSIEHHRKYADAPGFYAYAWSITNRSEAPIVIQSAIFNGEHYAKIANYDGSIFWLSQQQTFPQTLTIGDTLYLYEGNPAYVDYGKNVIFIDLYTDRGNFRFRPPWDLSPLPSGVKLPPRPKAESATQPPTG